MHIIREDEWARARVEGEPILTLSGLEAGALARFVSRWLEELGPPDRFEPRPDVQYDY